MATLIPADTPPREVAPRNGRAYTLEELKAIVGGYIEAVPMPDGRVMFLNEDGHRLALPVNRIATAIVRMVRPGGGDVVVGDVVICTLTEAGEDDAADE